MKKSFNVMTNELRGRKIAILATHGFEEVELTKPREALDKAAAETHLVSPERGTIKAWNHGNWSDSYEVDIPLEEADHTDYHGLMIPGGVMNPDTLRANKKAVEFVSKFLHAGKPIAAICHGPQLLIETKELQGKTMTSYPSIKTDLINAGVKWVDKEVVVDHGLTTSRKPDDIPAFNSKMIEEYREGVHEELAPN